MSIIRLIKRNPWPKLIFLALIFTCLVELFKQTDELSATRHLLENKKYPRRISDDSGKRLGHSSSRRHHARAHTDMKYKKTLGRHGGTAFSNSSSSRRTETVLLLNLSGKEIKVQSEIHNGIPYALQMSSVHNHKPAHSFALPPSLQSLVSKAMLENTQNPGKNFSTVMSSNKLNASLMEDVFRSGFGLEPYVTERGEQGWIENGVVYRPSRTSEDLNHKGDGSLHSEFEVYLPFNGDLFFEGRNKIKSMHIKDKDRKIILWHTKARYVPNMYNLQPMRKCPDFPCYITTHRKYAKMSSAMVFAGQMVRWTPPKRTSPNQVFVFHNQEPPLTKFFRKPTFKTRPWKDVFNWTMSYRMDSDIVSHYGILRKRPKPIEKNYTAILSKKNRLVAWIVSHCNSPGKREKYVAELKKYIPVDIYGDCGKLRCNRTMDDKCAEMISTKYKFYLSFENAICPDYISEKFFRYMSLNIITIARGSNQFSQHAPSEIFLNTADFASPRDLAKTLLYLDNHDDVYIKMLEQKDKYIQLYEDYTIRDKQGVVQFVHYHHEAVAFCEMCQKLWNLDKNTNVIPDIAEWFGRKVCREPSDLTF